MVTPRQLLDDFNEYRHHTNEIFKVKQRGKYARPLKMNDERKTAFNNMILFCTKHEIDPRMWLYFLFSNKKWLYTPKFSQLCIETNVAKFQNLKAAPKFQKKIRNEVFQKQKSEGRTYDCNRDIAASSEALKRRYVESQDFVRCMDEMMSKTFGYHPKSLVCARCPAMNDCKRKLENMMPFDVMALRSGEITSVQAQEQAKLAVANGSRRT
jgi:hypothetical protein